MACCKPMEHDVSVEILGLTRRVTEEEALALVPIHHQLMSYSDVDVISVVLGQATLNTFSHDSHVGNYATEFSRKIALAIEKWAEANSCTSPALRVSVWVSPRDPITHEFTQSLLSDPDSVKCAKKSSWRRYGNNVIAHDAAPAVVLEGLYKPEK